MSSKKNYENIQNETVANEEAMAKKMLCSDSEHTLPCLFTYDMCACSACFPFAEIHLVLS